MQNNNVGNCLVAGYKDDRNPTKSAWINNMALLNGHPKPSHHANFAIKWPNKPQVDKGTLGEYPKHPNKNFNTSLIYASKRSIIAAAIAKMFNKAVPTRVQPFKVI